MVSPIEQIKAWTPPVAGICAVVLASIYAFAKKSTTEQVIYELKNLGVSMSNIANDVCNGALAPTLVKTIADQQRELETRIVECGSPARVQRDLTDTMESVGVKIVEIKPEQGVRPGTAVASQDYPRLRIILEGDYSQIASFMDLCAKQRLPARVTRFTITRLSNGRMPDDKTSQLRADITVETLRPQPAAGKDSEAKAA